MLSLKPVILVPNRLAYTLVVIGTFLIVVGFLWYVAFEIVMPIRWASTQALSHYEPNNSTDTIFTLADTFVSNLWTFFLIFGVIAIIAWAIVYSQEKGRHF